MLAQGSSIDIVCAEVALGYENYLHKKATAEANGEPVTSTNKYTTNDLQAMLDRVKNKNAGGQ